MAAAQPDRRKAPRNDDPQLRGRRVEPRAYMLWPASVEGLYGRNSVSLLDVSRTGARLEGADLPEIGKDIILRCEAIDTLGTVVWAVGGRCVTFPGTSTFCELNLRTYVRSRISDLRGVYFFSLDAASGGTRGRRDAPARGHRRCAGP